MVMEKDDKAVFRFKENMTLLVEIKDSKGAEITFPTTIEAGIGTLLDSFDGQTVFEEYIPQNTVWYSQFHDGSKGIVLFVDQNKHDTIFFDKTFKNVGYPNLIFGFRLWKGKIIKTLLAVTKESFIKPNTEIYYWPYSNVDQTFNVCWGTNTLPEIKELSELVSLPLIFLTIPKNNDLPGVNKEGLDIEQLLKKHQGKDFDNNLLMDSNIIFKQWLENLGGK